MNLEVQPNGDVRVLRKSRAWIPAILLLLTVPVLLVGLDVFTLECDRAADRCTYASVGALHGGGHEGELRLSAIDYVFDSPEEVEGARSNERYTSVLHTAALRDGTEVELEGRRRIVFIDDGLRERFNEFRQGSAPRLEVRELHVGLTALPLFALLLVGLVLLVLARRVRFEASAASQRFHFRRRGVIGGFTSDEGAVIDLVAVELNGAGSYRGVYLAKRDGRRLKLRYGDAGEGAQRAAEQLAAALGLATGTVDDATVKRHASGVAPWSALGCMLLAFSPLAVPLLWCVLSGLSTP